MRSKVTPESVVVVGLSCLLAASSFNLVYTSRRNCTKERLQKDGFSSVSVYGTTKSGHEAASALRKEKTLPALRDWFSDPSRNKYLTEPPYEGGEKETRLNLAFARHDVSSHGTKSIPTYDDGWAYMRFGSIGQKDIMAICQLERCVRENNNRDDFQSCMTGLDSHWEQIPKSSPRKTSLKFKCKGYDA
jgi:hypothetical protein